MRFTHLVTLCEDDFMAGMEAYEDVAQMQVYAFETTYGEDDGFTDTYPGVKNIILDYGESIETVFGMDESKLIQQLKTGKCIRGFLDRGYEKIWISTDRAKIDEIVNMHTTLRNKQAAQPRPDDEL